MNVSWMKVLGRFLSLVCLVAVPIGVPQLSAQEEAAIREAGQLRLSAEFEGSGKVLAEAEALPKGFTPDSVIAKLPTIESVLGLLPETVCGADTRVRRTTTTTFPFRTTCQLVLTLPNGSQAIGTGFLIGAGTVATAGHCVHTGGPNGGWMRRIEVIPGRNGTATGSRPYGTLVSNNLRSVTDWTVNRSPNSDYGAIILSSKIGTTTGWLGFGVYNDTTLRNLTVNTIGYPGDKPLGTMWYTNGTISSLNSRRLFYLMDTAGGQSGSAVYRIINGSRIAVGIHAYGGCPNGATRITTGVFNNLSAWKALGGG